MHGTRRPAAQLSLQRQSSTCRAVLQHSCVRRARMTAWLAGLSGRRDGRRAPAARGMPPRFSSEVCLEQLALLSSGLFAHPQRCVDVHPVHAHLARRQSRQRGGRELWCGASSSWRAALCRHLGLACVAWTQQSALPPPLYHHDHAPNHRLGRPDPQRNPPNQRPSRRCRQSSAQTGCGRSALAPSRAGIQSCAAAGTSRRRRCRCRPPLSDACRSAPPSRKGPVLMPLAPPSPRPTQVDPLLAGHGGDGQQPGAAARAAHAEGGLHMHGGLLRQGRHAAGPAAGEAAGGGGCTVGRGAAIGRADVYRAQVDGEWCGHLFTAKGGRGRCASQECRLRPPQLCWPPASSPFRLGPAVLRRVRAEGDGGAASHQRGAAGVPGTRACGWEVGRVAWKPRQDGGRRRQGWRRPDGSGSRRAMAWCQACRAASARGPASSPPPSTPLSSLPSPPLPRLAPRAGAAAAVCAALPGQGAGAAVSHAVGEGDCRCAGQPGRVRGKLRRGGSHRRGVWGRGEVVQGCTRCAVAPPPAVALGCPWVGSDSARHLCLPALCPTTSSSSSSLHLAIQSACRSTRSRCPRSARTSSRGCSKSGSESPLDGGAAAAGQQLQSESRWIAGWREMEQRGAVVLGIAAAHKPRRPRTGCAGRPSSPSE